MSNSYIPGIENYPHLQRRLDYELVRLGNGCSNCERDRVYNKYRDIVSKQLARDEAVAKKKINRINRP